MTEQNNLPFPTDADAPQEKKTSLKPLAVVTLTATVIEEPSQKQVGTDVLWRTYCTINTTYRPFNTDIFTKNEPEVRVGDTIDIELTSYNYKLRMKRQ